MWLLEWLLQKEEEAPSQAQPAGTWIPHVTTRVWTMETQVNLVGKTRWVGARALPRLNTSPVIRV